MVVGLLRASKEIAIHSNQTLHFQDWDAFSLSIELARCFIRLPFPCLIRSLEIDRSVCLFVVRVNIQNILREFPKCRDVFYLWKHCQDLFNQQSSSEVGRTIETDLGLSLRVQQYVILLGKTFLFSFFLFIISPCLIFVIFYFSSNWQLQLIGLCLGGLTLFYFQLGYAYEKTFFPRLLCSIHS